MMKKNRLNHHHNNQLLLVLLSSSSSSTTTTATPTSSSSLTSSNNFYNDIDGYPWINNNNDKRKTNIPNVINSNGILLHHSNPISRKNSYINRMKITFISNIQNLSHSKSLRKSKCTYTTFFILFLLILFIKSCSGSYSVLNEVIHQNEASHYNKTFTTDSLDNNIHTSHYDETNRAELVDEDELGSLVLNNHQVNNIKKLASKSPTKNLKNQNLKHQQPQQQQHKQQDDNQLFDANYSLSSTNNEHSSNHLNGNSLNRRAHLDNDDLDVDDENDHSPQQTTVISILPQITTSSNFNEVDKKKILISSEDLNDNDNSIHSVLTVSTTESSTSGNLLEATEINPINFEFTKLVYNVTIPENSLSKVYATSTEKMGIYISDPALTVRYKIVAGDPEKIFRADHKHVGNFFFLMIRVRHDKNAVLNRENRSRYDLRIRAIITSEHNKAVRFKSKCNVTVTVLDCNDISPIFFEKSYDVDVLEDVPLESNLIQVVAIDPDIGPNGEIYYGLSEETNYFAIHPTLGIIYNTRLLFLHQLLATNDNSALKTEFSVNLTVFARDRGQHHSLQTIESSRTKVNIRILPVNRHPPQISIKQHSTLSATSPESIGSSIYAIAHVSDEDLGIYGQICSFNIIDGNDQSLFRITNQTSNDYNLQLAKSVFDLFSPSSTIPFELVVQASDCGGRVTNKTIQISLDDHLSLSLRFSSEKYFRELHESSLIGTQVLQIDLKIYNTYNDRIPIKNHYHNDQNPIKSIKSDLLHYSIINGNTDGTFGISDNGVIYTRTRLDYETVSNYRLVVQAYHQQLNQIVTTMIYIEIIDDNDNYPVFKDIPPNGIVQLKVNENKPNGSAIYYVRAEDLDSEMNNRYVTYEMIYYGPDQDQLPFSIDMYTGNIIIIQPLDYELMRRNYLLFIRASDWGEPFRRQNEFLLNVTINDVNDHRPQFEKINCSIFLPLNTKPYTELITLSAIDLDHYSDIIYKMFSQEAEHCFQLDEKTGKLELICNLKKEFKSPKLNKIVWTLSISATDGLYFADTNYINILLIDDVRNENRAKRLSSAKQRINVQCTDSGIRHKSKLQNRISSAIQRSNLLPEEKEALELLQVNNNHHVNHAPTFDDALLEIYVAENTPIGTKIATIIANDSDSGFEGSLIWSLNLQEIENVEHTFYEDKIYFEIGQFVGDLYVISPLDYEKVKQLKLLVTVCDQCINNQKCANKTVLVIIEDVNDNKPIVDNFVFKISESAKPKNIIGIIHATDKDSGDNALLEYYIDGHVDTFSMDLLNGTLRLEKKLDREILDKYILYVTVSDCGTPSLSSTAVIVIHVIDINDNAPLFFQSSYFLKVREDIPIGTRLMRISAFDQDEGDAGQIRYNMIHTENDTFSIDELTGNIRLMKAFDYEKIQLYNLTIVANDEGKPMLSTSTYLLLEVEDVNENYYPPKFPNFYDNATIKENMPIGTFVTKVTAIDQDNLNLPLIYQIIGDDGLGRFTIDSNGNIFTSVILDRESNSHFWLTIVAKDRSAVPLTNSLELYIEVEDVNDMPPITKESFYTVNVLENVSIDSYILHLEAYDQDLRQSDTKLEIMFNIVNKQVPFEVDSNGNLKTNGPLDRETTSRYVIDLDVMEPLGFDNITNSKTYLKTRTPIIINVLDVNEHEPKSIMNTYRCYTYSQVELNLSVCHIIAFDQDDDDHCPIRFDIIEGNEKKYFYLDANSGLIYPTVNLIPKGSYDFVVEISDCNKPNPLTSTVHVIIRVLAINSRMENHKPLIEPFDSIILINRDEEVGYTAAWIKSSDDDNDRLCFHIVDGNTDNSFAFLDTGALVIAKSLKNQFINQFNLTLLASDGRENSTINIIINILNELDDVVSFSQEKYVVNVLENITIGSDVLQLNVEENDQAVFSIYSTQSLETMTKFEVESWSGKIKIKSPLDYEMGKQHVMLIEARNGRKHLKSLNKRAFAKVIINVIDVNDQAPQFITSYFETNVVESSSIGTSILQVQAFDADLGNNAKINFSIASGNIDNTFDIEPDLGYLFVAKQLNFRQLPEYYLLVKATDQGIPSLSNTANVHILITLPDNLPPKFEQSNYMVDVREDEKIGTVIMLVKLVNKQTSFFSIINGNEDKTFAINVNNGELYLRRPLDYEQSQNYQLTIEAANLLGMNVTAKIFVNVVDINDNAPFWNETLFEGQVFESTPVNAFVQNEYGSPLIVRAYDKDSFHNLIYSIVEDQAKEYFTIESRTGAISLVKMLDCEKHYQMYFSVSVMDNDTPKLKASTDAMVHIKCLPVNDCPPVFVVNKFQATLLLPTYTNVMVTKLTATDCDYNPDKFIGSKLELHYELKHMEQNDVNFKINSTNGQIMTTKEDIKPGVYEMLATVTDGKFTTQAMVIITAKPIPISSLSFRQKRFHATIKENSSYIQTILLPTISGNRLHEHLIFRIMTPTNLFKIARTSGAILYRGIPVDRETSAKFELPIEVQSITFKHRIAQALVEITVEDINDNKPIFVGLPYNFVFSSDANVGSIIGKIQAVDMDSGLNGKVEYSIISGDENNLFALNSITGHLTLSRVINFMEDVNNFTLLVMAKDLGQPSMESVILVKLRIVSGGMPLFSEPYYNITISENHPPMLPFITIKAESPHGRQIFYNIEAGNDNDEFLLDFNTGTISIVEKLDRETNSQYNLLISAIDAVSGASSTVNVYIKVDDVNDNQPMFTRFYYNVSVPENIMIGFPILKVEAYDADIGLNSRLQYHIIGNKSYFFISPDEGVIYLKNSIDHETESFYHFNIMVTDYGTPQLTSTALVSIKVLDVNDNAPILPSPFTIAIDEDIENGAFVTKITAYDADTSDQAKLRYKIISGSDMNFLINETSGAIYVRNLKNFRNYYRSDYKIIKRHYTLNISVSDGVYSTTETYFIVIKPANHFSPKFNRILNNVAIEENQPIGSHILTMNSTDQDDTIYGMAEFHILNDYAKRFFSIDSFTGNIKLKSELDYELGEKFYWIILGAQDKGKRLGVSALRVSIIDQNDNTPRFIVDEYKCSICSNVLIDSTILSVLALDDDEDSENTVIYYSIYDDQKEEKNQTIDGNSTMEYINDYFEIASDTGYIYIRKNLSSLVGKKVQFFVKASNVNIRDKNTPKKLISNIVPITIEIVDSCPYHKREAFLYEVFVKENIERNSIVASLNLGHYKDVELSIVGLDNKMDMNKFRIDDFGRIYVNEPLDRESKSKHVLALKVSDKSFFTSDYYYVIINIMDENDCTPYFDSASYYLTIAENQETGSTIFKVNALDNDIDLLNNALKYSIQDNYNDTFRIDENYGWIVLNKALDRETIEHYNLQIDITDGLHHNSTSLYINVFDVNDNKPRIEHPRSIAAIYENSFLGTVILRIKVDDPDINPELRYYISEGDYLNHFAISSSGDVYVNQTLDRELIDHYLLKILVTDGKFYTESEVLIDVLDVNDNGPICLKSKYVEMVNEAVPVGTNILTVAAIDRDDSENAKLYFTLSGNHKDHFIVDSFTGRLRTNAKLDRETQSVYLFTVLVYDYQNRDWQCSSTVEILLSDVNDEPPKFLPQLNLVHVPENSPVGLILGKVNAIDLDISFNRQITYELINSTGEFVIHEKTGIIRLAKSLDRETEAFYNLTIIAYDINLTYLNATTNFMVNVTDINDNAPEFELQSYKLSVDENVPIGTEVVKIFATSKDTGINAEIHYQIINGNVNDTFAIDMKTGIVTVEKELDYETTNEYFLIVEAEDQGVPPLPSEVNLLININDINDMRPQFSQRSYDIVIREDAHVGDKIYQIVASDGDSPSNANLTYSFENGNLSYKEFNIEPIMGILTVGKQLDREMISSYILEVFCTDNGKPVPLSASVLINVEISDYNDNAPLFEKINQTVYLKETRPNGYKFLNFNIYDADSTLNSGPFKLEIIEGNDENKFAIFNDDSSLRTNALFNQSEKSEYNLKIKVTDSGNPPLHSFSWLTVIIIQESQTPPKVHPLSIAINSLDHFPGGLVGQINATDEDSYDKLTYSLTNPDDQNIFSLDPNEGFIHALPGLDVGKYKINITVTDGKFVSYGLVEVDVFFVTESMIENSLVIKLYSIQVREFINNYFKNFVRSIKTLFKVRMKDVIVISLQQINSQRQRRDGELLKSEDMSLMFAVSIHDEDFFSRDVIKTKLLENKYYIENQIGLSFDEMSHKSQCDDIKCENGKCHEELWLSEDQITYITSNDVTFVSPHHEIKFGCACHAGFGGKLCNITVNECYRNPCPAHKECMPVSSSLGYICQCPFGKSGPNCNQNAETCQANERDVLVCYQEFNPISFNGNSYVRYSYMKKIDKLSFRFRTQQLRARIFTQQNELLFVILEIVAGYIQYRFDCGEGEGLIRIHNLFVSDGKWHEIIVERKGNTALLILDRKYRSGGFAPGAIISCNRLKSDIYFGGEVKSKSNNVGDEDILYGFNGCLDNILFNGQQIPFHKTSKSAIVILKTLANVEFSCSFKPDTGACRSQPCLNGGICDNFDNGSFICSCHGHRFKGKHCEIDTLPCNSSPCLNEGVCLPDIESCERGLPNCYKCQCRSGFTGTNCQISNHCSENFCQNGGVCEETSIGPKCHCHSGWHGLNCQYDIDECQLTTPACHIEASCINLPGTFRCVCPINSTAKCHGHSLLTNSIIGSYLHISHQKLLGIIILLVMLFFIVLLCIICCKCCNGHSKNKKTTKKDKKQESGSESLLKNRLPMSFENCDSRIGKNNNFEMSQLTNVSHRNQRSATYQELFNNNSAECNSVINSEELESQTPNTVLDYSQNFKKNAPIASVSPQMVEIKQSVNNHKKGKKRIKITVNAINHETHKKRTSLNGSSDSNVFENDRSPATHSNQTENYHWDTSDLCLAENESNNNQSFQIIRYDFNTNDVETSSQNSHPESIKIESSHHLMNSTSVKSINIKNRNDEESHDDESSLLLAKNEKSTTNEKNLSSPPLEVKLGPKLEFSKNYIERYLPKHEEDLEGKKNPSEGSDGTKQKMENISNDKRINNKNESTPINNTNKPGTFLTFNRSLNESTDNFSLLTPSSSCSITPMVALIANSSASDTIDQCSSSMSSSSNNDLKISPMSSSFIGDSKMSHNNYFSSQNDDIDSMKINGNKKFSSFVYSNVSSKRHPTSLSTSHNINNNLMENDNGQQQENDENNVTTPLLSSFTGNTEHNSKKITKASRDDDTIFNTAQYTFV